MATYANSTTGRTGTVQSWTVPSSGLYKIECWGAEGGAGNGGVGGKGAYRYGEMTLTAGDEIKIIVGQAGVRSGSGYEAGGGGGSFVYKQAGTVLLCAAGGGGGGSQSGPGANGVTTEAGVASPGGGGAGGTGGSGGAQGWGAAGGGWLTMGAVGTWSPTDYTANRPGSAASPSGTFDTSAGGAQATGGQNTSGTAPSPVGGFGGGASAHGNSYTAGGGGGGYSGGGGANQAYGGGGGGSFVHASMANTGGTAGTRTGHGQVIITSLNAPPIVSITAPTAGQKLDPRLQIQMTWSYSDAEGDLQTKYEVGVRLDDGAPVATYSAVSSSGYTGTIQSWTVPQTKSYRLTAQGASGGYNPTLPRPGYGAIVAADFSLTAGHVIKILVGQVGDLSYQSSSAGMGGGGGTFVYNETTGTLLLAAGGGGGPGGQVGDTYRGCDASLTTSPNNHNGTYASGFADATPGLGGNDGYYGGGGAGWNSNGQGQYSTQGYRMLDATYPGRGGFGYSGSTTSYAGGFGGGGGGSSTGDSGGGGGGYTGGNGGSTTDRPGGGGGSYAHSSATAVTSALATATGAGSVVITGTFDAQEFVSSNTYHNFPANTLPDESELTLRVRAFSGSAWGEYATVIVTSDSWNYVTEVVSPNQTGVDLPELAAGAYDAQVRTADEYDYGPWSSTASFRVWPTSSTKIRESGAWRTVPLFVRVGGQWVALKKRRMP